MTEPRQLLATTLVALAAARDPAIEVNVADHPTAQLPGTPALVIRPDTPWRIAAPADKVVPFNRTREQYAVVAIVQAGDPASAIDDLRQLVILVEDVQDAGLWRWVDTSGVVQIKDAGIDYLGSTVRLQYLEG